MDVNERLNYMIAEMRDIGQKKAHMNGGSFNDYLLYSQRREQILCVFLDAWDNGYRLEMKK